ncbi:hypothetical protein [Halanaeroarchaeum sp. HSR-CO]|uniref:hypothetical protein n=1 Tax=Halanaeroarchaeum sp. HSR-CO TaxID=2866382 RepID=UPI00217DB87B|nr:hypothetical protein [Halanaeroarchaeum sp. HSR-CO]
MQQRRRRILLLILAVAVLVSFAASVTARPPPQPLCEVCSDDVVADSVVEESTVSIEIDGTGTGRWVVTFDLDDGVTPDGAQLQRDAREALRGHHEESMPRNLSVDVSGDTAVVTYEVPEMGHRALGDVLVVDYFYSHGDESHWYGVNADRVVVRGPTDTTLTRAPQGVRSNESAIVLTGTHGDIFDQTISTGWYLAFADEDTVFAAVGTTIGIGIDIAAAKIDGLAGAIWLPMAILISVLGVLYRRGAALAERTLFQRLRFGVALGAALAVGSVVVELVGGSSEPLLEHLEDVVFSLLFGAVLTSDVLLAMLLAGAVQFVLVTPRIDIDVPTTLIPDGAVAVSVMILLGSVWAAGTAVGATAVYGTIVAVLTPLLFLPLGQTVRRRHRVVLTFTIVVAPILLALGFGPFSEYTKMFFPTLYVPWALVTGAIGAVGYSYGLTIRAGPSD